MKKMKKEEEGGRGGRGEKEGDGGEGRWELLRKGKSSFPNDTSVNLQTASNLQECGVMVRSQNTPLDIPSGL